MKLATLLSVLAATIAACKSVPPADPQRVAEAVQLARRFMQADTGANYGVMDSLYAPKEDMPVCVIGFDAYTIIDSATIGDPHAKGDTIIVPLTYQVLGSARSEDSHQVGPQNMRFVAAPSVKRESLVAGPDPTGRLRFSCWRQVVPNHMTADHMVAKIVPHLDSASLAEWNAVNEQRPNKRLKLAGAHK